MYAIAILENIKFVRFCHLLNLLLHVDVKVYVLTNKF